MMRNPSADGELTRPWPGAHVHRVLEQLPEQQRTHIELAYWSGLSQSEMAAQLNVPMRVVRMRTRAALMHLAELLEADERR